MSIDSIKTSNIHSDNYRRDVVNNIQNDIEEKRLNHKKNISRINKEFQEEEVNQKERNRKELESVRNSGYENILKEKKEFQRLLRDMKDAREDLISRLKEHHFHDINRIHNLNRNALENIEKTFNEKSLNNEKAILETEDEFSNKLIALKQEREDRIEKERDISRHVVEQEMQKLDDFNNKNIDSLRGRYKEIFNDNRKIINDLKRTTKREIDSIIEKGSNEIDDYLLKSKDPFYSLVKINASLYEDKKAYYLDVDIPAHLHDSISIIVQENYLVLQGTRRSEKKLEKNNGNHTTNNYQSFSRSFKLDFPVKPNAIAKKSNGNNISVVIPKKGKW